MVAQIVDWIVGGADTLHVVAAHESACGISWLLQLLVTFVEDFSCCLRTQEFVDAESGLQLEVGPVVKRVAESVRNGLCPFLKLLPV